MHLTWVIMMHFVLSCCFFCREIIINFPFSSSMNFLFRFSTFKRQNKFSVPSKYGFWNKHLNSLPYGRKSAFGSFFFVCVVLFHEFSFLRLSPPVCVCLLLWYSFVKVLFYLSCDPTFIPRMVKGGEGNFDLLLMHVLVAGLLSSKFHDKLFEIEKKRNLLLFFWGWMRMDMKKFPQTMTKKLFLGYNPRQINWFHYFLTHFFFVCAYLLSEHIFIYAEIVLKYSVNFTYQAFGTTFFFFILQLK